MQWNLCGKHDMLRAILLYLLISAFALAEDRPVVTLSDAVISTLQNQRDIQIAILNIQNQEGVLQSSAGPFHPSHK